MRRRFELSQALDEFVRVVPFVATDGHAARRWTGDETDRRVALAGAGYRDDAGIDDETVSILHQDFAENASLPSWPFAFLNKRLSGSFVDWCV